MYKKRYSIYKVISLFCGDYSKEIYLREISRQTLLQLRTTQNVLAELEKEKILKSEVEGKNKYFSLNLDNPRTKLLIAQAEIYKTELFLQKYPLLNSFVKELNNNIPIIVFGSFARLEANKNSDIDLLIVRDKKESEEEKTPFGLIPFKVHEIRISGKSFDLSVKTDEALIKEVQSHHVVLNNHSFYVSTMWKHAKR